MQKQEQSITLVTVQNIKLGISYGAVMMGVKA
jgi:hypothetical protein